MHSWRRPPWINRAAGSPWQIFGQIAHGAAFAEALREYPTDIQQGLD
jgi:hypothetical protein